MPVSITAADLLEICAEIGLTGSSRTLLNCISNAKLAGYDPTYFTSPATSMLEFRNYDHTPTIYTENLYYQSGFSGLCPSGGSFITRYTTGSSTFSAATGLYTTIGGTTWAPTGYYRQGTFWRHWNGTSGVFGTSGIC